jgi:hypothetical protein
MTSTASTMPIGTEAAAALNVPSTVTAGASSTSVPPAYSGQGSSTISSSGQSVSFAAQFFLCTAKSANSPERTGILPTGKRTEKVVSTKEIAPRTSHRTTSLSPSLARSLLNFSHATLYCRPSFEQDSRFEQASSPNLHHKGHRKTTTMLSSHIWAQSSKDTGPRRQSVLANVHNPFYLVSLKVHSFMAAATPDKDIKSWAQNPEVNGTWAPMHNSTGLDRSRVPPNAPNFGSPAAAASHTEDEDTPHPATPGELLSFLWRYDAITPTAIQPPPAFQPPPVWTTTTRRWRLCSGINP